MYWLWRDRKGLIGNPLSLLANAVFVYGVATSLWTRIGPAAARVGMATLALQLLRTAIRMACVARIYGVLFSLGVPFRAVYANALNSAATFQAVGRYAVARALGRPLKWLKTEHAYPTRATLLAHKRKLGEILVSSGYLHARRLAAALASLPPSLRLGEHLVNTGRSLPKALYEALSLQQGLPVAQSRAGVRTRRSCARAARANSSASGRCCPSASPAAACSWRVRKFPRLRPPARCGPSPRWNCAFTW